MAFAIHLQTESSDDYLIAIDGEPTFPEVRALIEERMGEEMEYVNSFSVDATYDVTEIFKKLDSLFPL
jgi:hypothetical protein